jgi:hypothetical protein
VPGQQPQSTIRAGHTLTAAPIPTTPSRAPISGLFQAAPGLSDVRVVEKENRSEGK